MKLSERKWMGRRCALVWYGMTTSQSADRLGRGPMQFKAMTQARAVVMPIEISLPWSWNATCVVLACLDTCMLMVSTRRPPNRPILKHRPRSLICVRVNRPVKTCKAQGSWSAGSSGAPSTNLNLIRQVRVRACLSKPKRWWSMPKQGETRGNSDGGL